MDGDHGGADFGMDGVDHHGHNPGGFDFDGMSFVPDSDVSHGTAEHSVDQPFGDLLGGLETGLGFVCDPHEGGTTVGVDSLGHNNSLAELTATAIAVELALSHGGTNELSGFSVGHMHDVPALQGVCHEGHGNDEGRLLNLPGVARTRTNIEVLAWPHGKLDVQAQVIKLAEQAGLTRIKVAATHNMKDIDRTTKRLLSNAPFTDPDHRVNKPNGWYRAATGQTQLFRQYWQLQPTVWPWPLSMFLNDTTFEKWRTFLVITGAMWHYDQPDDYETRVSFSVYTLPFAERGAWTFRFDHMKTHRDAAERIAKRLLPFLNAQAPGARSLDVRGKLQPRDGEPERPVVLPPTAPPPVSTGGVVPFDHASPATEGAGASPDWVLEEEATPTAAPLRTDDE